MNESKKRLMLLPVFCVIFAVFSRLAGILYTTLATNVIYRDTVICLALPYIRQILSVLSFASAATGSVGFSAAGKSSALPYSVYAAVLFLDVAAVILYDSGTGALEGRLLFGIFYRLLIALFSFLMLLCGRLVAYLLTKKGMSLTVSAAAAAVVMPVAELISVIYSCVSLLIEVEFLPFRSEIISMSSDIAVSVISAALAVLFAVILFRRHISSEGR